jgi:hypothetical protein
MTEFLNIQNCIDIKLASAAPKSSSEALIKDNDEFSSPPRNKARHLNEDVELNIELTSPMLTQTNKLSKMPEDSDDAK